MRCYEHTFIARQDLSPQQAQALAETYTGVLTEHGAEVTKTEYWGLRNLSYRIRKNRKGHYLHLNVRAPADAIDELERQERLSDDVLRYLTVKVDQLEEAPSIVMQTRSSREERSRRSHDDDDRPRRARDDDERPQRSREGEAGREQDESKRADERPRRSREGEAGRGPDESKRPEERPHRSRQGEAARGQGDSKRAEERPAKAEAADGDAS
jgi:small subunit ribosomal protein S6